MQNFTPICATVAEISATRQRKKQKPIYPKSPLVTYLQARSLRALQTDRLTDGMQSHLHSVYVYAIRYTIGYAR